MTKSERKLQTKLTSNRALPPNAGKGRKAGTPNRIGAEIKTMILGALETAGGEAYLAEQAALNPVAFMTLLAKILPRENASAIEGVYAVNVVTGVNRD